MGTLNTSRTTLSKALVLIVLDFDNASDLLVILADQSSTQLSTACICASFNYQLWFAFFLSLFSRLNAIRVITTR